MRSITSRGDRMNSRRTLLAVGVALLAAVVPVQAQVGDWPKRQPIRMISVFPPGGSVDQVARDGSMGMPHVPYKGGGPLMQDVVAGHVPLSIATVFVTKPHIDSKRLRPLAVATSKRSPELPDVPTLAESGFPGFEAPAWWGVLASAKTPPEIIQRMNAELNKALKVPEIAQRLAGQGINVIGGTPETARTFIDKQIDTWAVVVKENNIKAE